MSASYGMLTFRVVLLMSLYFTIPACFAAGVLDKCPAQFAQSGLNGQSWVGASTSCVFDLQRALNVVIDAGLETDSQLGDLTTAAIKEFQGGTPGLEVDGIVGPKTTAAINARFAAVQANTPNLTPLASSVPVQTEELSLSMSGCQNEDILKLMTDYQPSFKFSPAGYVGIPLFKAWNKLDDLLEIYDGACWGACQFMNCGTGGCEDNPAFGHDACWCQRCADGAGSFLTDLVGLIPTRG